MITVKTTTEVKDAKPFPKLMKSVHSGNIVLFYKNGEGVLIKKVSSISSSRLSGEYASDWAMDVFTDYNEPITIQNA